MTKKLYKIEGLDCPNCAAKLEQHLNYKDAVAVARIDFHAKQLSITYIDEIYSIEQLKEFTKEVLDEDISFEEIA